MGWLLILAPLLLIVGALSLVRAGARRHGARGSWGALLTSPVTISAAVLAGLVSAILWWTAARTADPHCRTDGKCGFGVAPLGEWSDSGPFRARAESDDICRATVWCTGFSEPNEGEHHRLLFGVRSPPAGVSPEGCNAACSIHGRCSAVDGACQAKTDTDCALTEPCVLWGHCSASGGRCLPARDEDCAGSRACRVLGRCSAIGGACRSADHLELPFEDYVNQTFARNDRAISDEIYRCRKLDGCRDDGRCDLSATGHCVVGTDEDCRSSAACPACGACQRWSDNEQAECAASCADTTLCKEQGRCVQMAAGLCGVGESRDCEESEACRLDGRCALVDGTCQATVEICATWDGCLFDGRCGVTAGECRLTEDGCAHSIPCAKLGACSASTEFEGCGVGSHADCAGSEVCEEYGWCRAIPLGYWPMSTSRWFCFSEPKQ